MTPALERNRHRAVMLASLCLTLFLLVATIIWQIPMMLWDHLDLIPVYQAWHAGRLADSGFLRVQGGHLHTAAYAILLATTRLSGGRTWLDGLTSWLLLLGYAGVILHFTRARLANDSRIGTGMAVLIAFLALFPGHLANLQWGWQVAVFLCLSATVVVIAALTRPALSWQHLFVAVLATLLAGLSFATAVALIPTAVCVLALRVDQSPSRRLAFALPWLGGFLWLALAGRELTASIAPAATSQLVAYTLNFLGAGIARFATDLAPWLALAALASCVPAWLVARRQLAVLPWLGLVVFAVAAALLAAIGRAGAYGSDQAFATRYISFSSMFWIGWSGLVGCALATLQRTLKIVRIAVGLVALMASLNALHLIKKAHGVSERTQAIATRIRRTYPNIDRALLAEIYFNRPDVARSRVESLHQLGFAPFDPKANTDVRELPATP